MFVAFHFTERCLEDPLLNCIIIDTPVWVGIWVHLRFLSKYFCKNKKIFLVFKHETICSILSISSVARSREVYPVSGRRAEHVKTPTGRKENPDRILEGRELWLSFPQWSSMILCLLQVIFNNMRMSLCLKWLELWRRAISSVFLRVKSSKTRQIKESLCLHFTQTKWRVANGYFSLIIHENIQRVLS